MCVSIYRASTISLPLPSTLRKITHTIPNPTHSPPPRHEQSTSRRSPLSLSLSPTDTHTHIPKKNKYPARWTLPRSPCMRAQSLGARVFCFRFCFRFCYLAAFCFLVVNGKGSFRFVSFRLGFSGGGRRGKGKGWEGEEVRSL